MGKSIARRLYLEGANVVVSSRRQENVDRTVSELSGLNLGTRRTNTVSGIVCHVGDESHRRRLVEFTLEKYGKIDCFVSNAGVNPHVGPILDISESKLDKIYEINYKSVLLLTQLIVPHMKQQATTSRAPDGHQAIADGLGPSVVFVSSASGFVGLPNIGAYAAMKASLFTLTKVLANEHASDNIRFNCVAPGAVDTKFGNVLKDENLFGSTVDSPMKRMGEKNELDGLVAYLLSDEASFVNGETICVVGATRTRL